ncbi:AlbA family DNA-binding domain-containing protein [Deinococcus saxicola]|uniref:AlbA family DNA-binding domain-containing protein n=1 Tax=Deinococcus saxicola TaxID=249406 RepID=UPI0039EDF8C7
MTKHYLPDELEKMMNQAIDQQVEGPKIDFKREISLKGEDFAELLKDLCAIGNTDDLEHYRGEGFLIIGVERDGTFYGLPQEFDADKLSASLNDTFNRYIAPPLHVRVAGPFQHSNGQYAVVQIPESFDQPHMIVKETGSARPGQWWVRSGDVNAMAGPQDYSRVLRKAVGREVTPLRDELTLTRGLLTNLEQRLERFQVAGLQRTESVIADAPVLPLAAKIRAQYDTPDTALRQALHREWLIFLEAFEDQFPDESVVTQIQDQAVLKEMVIRMQEITKPLGESLAAAVTVGQGELDDVVGKILVWGMEKTLTFPRYRSLNETIENLRSYPLILLTFAVCAAAIQAKRTAWLRPYLKATSRHFLQNHGRSEMLDPTRILVRWEETLQQLFNIKSCAPAYQHIINVVLGADGWLSGGDPFANDSLLVAETELFQSLVYMDGPRDGGYLNDPIPNTLAFLYGADDLILTALRDDLELFKSSLDEPIDILLTRFVKGVSTYSGGSSGRRLGCRVQVTAEILKGLP